MRIHSGEKPFSCDICLRGFVQASGLRVHMRDQHTTIRQFVCPHPQCQGLAYKRKHRLQVHLADIHGAPRKYPCMKCNRGYNCKRLLEDHIRSVHSKETPWTCSYCGKSYSRSVKWKNAQKLYVKVNKKHGHWLLIYGSPVFLHTYWTRYYYSSSNTVNQLNFATALILQISVWQRQTCHISKVCDHVLSTYNFSLSCKLLPNNNVIDVYIANSI